ncbi:DUF6252 family protein [Pontibacter fetidus]|uniref:Uncharacterized protein n=1 Tax=Pontibacter fetidus TaxID=2700082 RepID=A0A6B2H3P0_9BACT|nr:DUF6252 family protein [Pontibacter fetidus]NDK54370.1 hypothetical protein [Pontibacter fetidus]
MKKTLLYFSLAALTFLNFSCDTDGGDADEVIPEMALTMHRAFMYHDNHETKNATYTSANLQSAFLTENERLTIYVGGDKDDISFEIAEADLPSGYVGNYVLKSLPNPDNGKAKTSYSYATSPTSGSVFFSQANAMNGSVEITNYNEKHQLISGTFELTMENVPDPTATSPTNPRSCDVTITGTFANAKLKATL